MLLQVLLLMPFLATDWSSKRQRLLRIAARFSHQLGGMAGALGRLPPRLLDVLVHVAEPAAEPHTRQGIKELLNTNGVRNNLHLAMHEFRYGVTLLGHIRHQQQPGWPRSTCTLSLIE
jgi:hypothetical protein